MSLVWLVSPFDRFENSCPSLLSDASLSEEVLNNSMRHVGTIALLFQALSPAWERDFLFPSMTFTQRMLLILFFAWILTTPLTKFLKTKT